MATSAGPAVRTKFDSTVLASQPRRNDIQLMRAFAVVVVVAYHLRPDLMPGGFIGVDVFFVISGYLVGGGLINEALSAGHVNWRAFYARRVRRIVPAATVVALASLAIASVLLSPLQNTLLGPTWDEPSVSRDGIAASLSVVNLWHGAQANAYDIGALSSPFTHYWSLGVEEQFYLGAPLMAVAVVAAARKRRRDATAIVAALVVWGFIFGVAVPWLITYDGFFDPLSRAWEFGAGILVAMAAPRLREVRKDTAPSAVATSIAWLTLIALAFSLKLEGGWPGLPTLAPVGASVALLALGLARSPGRIVNMAVFQWVGDRSYSIYLWHWPIIIAADRLTSHAQSWAVGAGVVFTTLLAAHWTYRWVEQRFMRRVSHRRPASASLLAAGALLSVMVASVAVGGRAFDQLQGDGGVMATYDARPVGEGASQAPVVVPSNLRPQIFAAAEDESSIVADGCNTDLFAEDFVLHDCHYGRSGPIVVLFGDSHAAQWFDAFVPAFETGRMQMVVLTASGCPPIDLVGLRLRDECNEWRQSALARIRALQPSLVLLSMRTTYDEVDHHDMLDAISGGVPQLLAEMPVGAAWIADVPKYADSPASCASGAYADVTGCTGDAASVIPAAQNSALEQASLDAGAAWIDMTPYLCDDTSCPIILGDVLVYRDDDHLTATFARALAPVLEPEVLKISRRQ
ncbi:acyltransferase family protein [Demequina phytophila]|uniref:acyltransferase family protein n=1 Tax=Demequina phytophila TaxID=1638981 RepID=UPI000ABBCF5B|nr:acyltransferase family protein [Demequina phytophila]